ncbi:MAG: hypothetical protein K2F71_07350 [Paramuribaculum sp.]|nr:hypothetical protein [Paramuribaculum sp.]
MKKLVLVLAVAFSASLFSCGNKAENAGEAIDTTAAVVEVAEETVAVVDTLTNDTVATDTTVVAAVVE